MLDYSVRFICHVVPSLKPPEWPESVVHEAVYKVKEFAELRDNVNKQIWVFIKQGGTTFMKDSKRPFGEDIQTLDCRVFVPLHMISHVETETKKLVTEIPNVEDEGVIFQ